MHSAPIQSWCAVIGQANLHLMYRVVAYHISEKVVSLVLDLLVQGLKISSHYCRASSQG